MEYLLIFLFICIQLLFFLTTYFRIQRISDLFPPVSLLKIITVSNNINDNSITKTNNSKNKVNEYTKIEISGGKKHINIGFISIINSTNEYLKNNSGSAVDFNIIRDIAERINSAYESSINSTISIPLYIGLLGTMFGIVYGIFNINMPLDDSSLFILLDGVKLAMIASIAGLFLTLVNSSFILKNSIFKRDLSKNSYFTYIQTNLLPVLTKDMVSSLSNIHYQLEKFNKEFFDNIQMLDVSLGMITDNIKNQKEVIETINKIKISDIARINLDLLEKFERSTKSFEVFITYQTNLNNLLEKFSSNILIGNEMISKIVSARNEIDDVMNSISNTVNTNKETSEFLKMNFSKLRAINDTTNDIVSEQENRLRDVTEAFSRELDNTHKTLKDNFKDNIEILTKELDDINSLFKEEIGNSFQNNIKLLKFTNDTDSLNFYGQELKELTEVLLEIKFSFNKSLKLQSESNEILETLSNELKIDNSKIQMSFKDKFKLLFRSNNH